MAYICIDIGGTKTLVCSLSTSGEIVESVRFATPRTYASFLHLLSKNVANISTKDATLVVVGAPGKIDHDSGTGLVFGNLPWKNVPLKKDISALLGLTVLVQNDAKLAALAEAQPLKDRYRKIMYITISTGINIGLVVDGKLDDALSDSEAGQQIVEYSGQTLKWERIASGSALVRTYGMQASELSDPKAWDDMAHKISLGLINLISILQPNVIVFGGGVGTHYHKFARQLHKALNEFRNPLVSMPAMIQAQNPEHAVIYGCYQLARSHETPTE